MRDRLRADWGGDMRRSRAAAGTGMAVILVAAGLAAGPAFGEDPPLVWEVMDGFPVTVDDVTITFETTTLSAEIGPGLLDMPLQRINILNESGEERVFDFGIDMATEGVIEPSWLPGAFGPWTELEPFTVRLAPGQSSEDVGSILWKGPYDILPGVPIYPGRTVVVYERSEDPDGPYSELLRAPRVPGQFVPVHFDPAVRA